VAKNLHGCVRAAQVDGLTRLMLEGRKGPSDGEQDTSPKRRGNRRDTWAPGLTGALTPVTSCGNLLQGGQLQD
jgi:hypothetical protein